MNIFGKKIAAITPGGVLRRLILVWYFSHKYLFLALLLVTVSYGLWFWKQTVYQYHWTDEEKRAYLDQHAKETNFKEENFKKALDAVSARKGSFNERGEYRDIFY